MRGPRLRALLAAVAALFFALAPYVSGSFGGYGPDAFPVPQIDPPVQPAGWAFAIWGVIYLWLVVHTGFGLWRRSTAEDWDRTRGPLILSLAIGTVWIEVAQTSPVWATVLIWAMWGGAVWALMRAPARDSWLAAVPLGLYAGWLTAAASVSLGLIGAGYGLVGPVAAAWIALFLAVAIGLAVTSRTGAPGYAAALAWALVALSAKNVGPEPLLAGAAAVAGVAILAAAIRARPAPGSGNGRPGG